MKLELRLKNLNDKYGNGNGRKSDLQYLLQKYRIRCNTIKMPKIDKKIIDINNGFIRQKEKPLSGLVISHYLKEIIVAFAASSKETGGIIIGIIDKIWNSRYY